LRESESLVATAKRCCDPFTGTLRLGVIPTISPYLLPSVAPALRAAYPGLTLQWVEEKTHVLFSNLNPGTIDAAVLALEAEIGDVEQEVIARDPFILVTTAENPLANKKLPPRPPSSAMPTFFCLQMRALFRQASFRFLFPRARP
jgi:LysR family hydrogen peroxide-inducible transcriptional activator